MMNIGMRPTVGGNDRTIEVHFFDFNKNIYNQTIKVELLYFLRNEQKFISLNELKKQLNQDEKDSKRFLKSYANF